MYLEYGVHLWLVLFYFRVKGNKILVKIAVCDDDSIFLNELVKQITQLFQSGDKAMEYHIDPFEDGGGLLKYWDNEVYDIVFLDIEMPGTSGILVADRIRMRNPYVKILFITNRDDLVFSSIQYRPFRFIRKNYLENELPEAINALINKLHQENKYLTVSFNGAKTNIKIINIHYIESCKHDIYIYTLHDTFRIKGNLIKLENQLEPYGFIRTHSGYVVNSRYIFSIDKTQVVLNDGREIPLSRYRVETVKHKLQLYGRGTEE